VTSKSLNAKGVYVTSYQIFDGLLRPRQTQTISLSGDGTRLVADTIYDRQGRIAASYVAHAEPGSPSGTLWWEPEWSLPSVTKTEFDRASRPVVSAFYAGDGVTNLVEKWRTTTSFEGDLIKSTPPSGGIATTTLLDSDGRTVALRQHTTAAGVGGAYQETKYQYDSKGRPSKTIDPAGNEWVYTYDAKGRPKTVKDPDKGTTTNEYSDANELIKTIDARGEVLYYVYDQLGRKKELRDDSAVGALRAEWKYDSLYSGQTGFRGQLTQAIRYEPAGTSNAYKWQVRQMDGRYNATGINTVIPAAETGLAATYITGYGYSAYTGAPTSITYGATADLPTETVTTDYDTATGLPVRLDTNRTGQTGTMLSTWYSNYGEPTLTTKKMPGGVYVDDATEYDPYTRRITRTTIKPETAAGNVSDRNYTYDPAGNITSVEDKPQIGSTDTQCFRYNWVNQLTSAWTPKAGVSCLTDPAVPNLGGPAQYWLDWTFDSTGSRKTEISHAAAGNTTRTYTIPTGGAGVVRPHAVTTMTTTAPGQSAVTVNYQYDASGDTVCRPTGATANTCPTGTGSQELVWNAEGKLEQAKVNGTPTETNIYDASGNRLVRRDSTGTTVYLPGQEIRREGTVNKGTRYYLFAGKVCASRNGSAISWLYSDHHGTQQTAVKADTQAVTTRRQTPYGGARGTDPSWPNQKGFVGGDKDPTGLTNIGARQYDPVLGRFISVDPLLVVSDPAQYNAYQYGAGNPIGNSDPTGMGIECGGGTGAYHCSNEVPMANGKGWFHGESTNTEATPAEIEQWRKIAEAERKKRECEADFWCRQGQKLKDAGNAAMNWAVDHADVVGLVAGVVVGVGCTALTGGGGAILCGALGGAISGLVTGALKCKGGDESHCGAGLVLDVGLGAALGALGGAAGAVVGGALSGGLSAAVGSGARAVLPAMARGAATAARGLLPKTGQAVKAFGAGNLGQFLSGSARNIAAEFRQKGLARQSRDIATDLVRGMFDLKNGAGPALAAGAMPGSRDDIKDLVTTGWTFKPWNMIGPALGGGFGD
jgi:RHS repeat-associated protein